MTDSVRETVRSALRNVVNDPTALDAHAILQALADAGYVVVPKEPTKRMAAAGDAAVSEVVDWTQDTVSSYIIEDPMRWAMVAYAAMIAAAQEGDSNDG